MRIVEIFKDWRVLLLIVLVVLSIVWIYPFSGVEGVVVRVASSPASVSIEQGYIITEINGLDIKDLQDYTNAVASIEPDDVVRMKYKKLVFPYYYVSESAYPFVAEERNNETYLGLAVATVPSSNLDFGLEVVGGTKVLLQPERSLNPNEVENIMAVFDQRLNIYGLREIPVSYQQDLSGNQYFRLEFAGASEEEVRELIEKEGKFEAKILNETVITGADILSICLTGQQCISRIDPVQSGSSILWSFTFQVDISQEAAVRFANATAELETGDCDATGCYLNATIDFYMDDEPIEGSQLRISADLKGEQVTNPVISGTRESKLEAEQEMRRMQAILQSGELPVKMTVVNIHSISPRLGSEFAQSIFMVFFIAIIAVDIVIAIRYRNAKIVLPIMIVSFSEIFITLGVASLINWTLDLASIAGLVAAVGIGVNDQIVITDEVLHGEKVERGGSIRKRISRAFFIIVAVFASTIAIMLPLLFAGAGILRGFAITTIIASTTGILITRPAFAKILEVIHED